MIYSPTPKQNNKFHKFIAMFILYLTYLCFISIIGDKLTKAAGATHVQEAQVILL